ncbi:MBL fold metallo-hydrolase [Variovorax sp. J22R133]|uniref:MBL fold metallo-hydrolase n=1 Tax=Variovorax brevis TaxID=3053503 RepID=UPI002578CB13|nr:MBL fold metallo-hydrolase [Variovorax sp. J22R133]MDM0114804.1 MBL fold metallo-hydrolase [Variovorax sp. J22R133]
MSHSRPLPRGVHVLERGWLSSNNVVFSSGERTALVDSGYCTHSPQTLSLVANALNGRPLELLLNTHLHSDHCGGNAALQSQDQGVRTLIPPGEAQAVSRWDEDVLSYRATGQECPRFRFDGLLIPGESVVLGESAWQIHAAPGHDPHSVILFEASSRTLISADSLWEHGFGVVFPELLGEPSFAEVAATLDLIERLSPLVVIPGHGPIFDFRPDVLGNARERLHAFVQSPVKHARHALKVLIKFKLLDAKRLTEAELMSWWAGVPYIHWVQDRFFPGLGVAELGQELLADLVRTGAATVEDGYVIDR